MNLPSIKVSVWPFPKEGKIKATAKVTFGDAISICPIKIIKGKAGLFLGMPQLSDQSEKYRDVFHPCTGKEGFLTRYGIDDIKGTFANEIFKMDLEEIYKAQTMYRDNLRRMAKEYMQQLRDLPQVAGELTQLIPLLMKIKRRLPEKGKLKYGYMPKDVKNLVDEVVDKLEKNPKVAELYDLWCRQKCAIIATYTSNFPSKEPLSENEAFRPIKNAVLETANEMPLVMMIEGARVLKNETQTQSGHQILEETLARIEREHQVTEETPEASHEEYIPSFRSIESFLYRVSKVFEEKKLASEEGQTIDRKAFMRMVKKKIEIGIQ